MFVRHVRSHRINLELKCEYCDFKLANRDQYIVHINEHKLDYECSVCGEFFHDRSVLNTHTYMYISKHQAPRHEPNRVTVPIFPCKICGMSFATSQLLSQHELIHRKGTHGCDQCGNTFEHKSSLDAHKYIEHNVSSFVCELCRKPFSTFSEFKAHEEDHEKPYKCSQCTRRFRHANHRQSHMHQHANETPYTCKICNVSFKTRSVCTRHERRHSTPYYSPLSNVFSTRSTEMAAQDHASSRTNAQRLQDSILEDWSELVSANDNGKDELSDTKTGKPGDTNGKKK
ncbi:hypothetical protein PYW08_011432 [Mythimna loreyi]|uniref:Uncharacterized protein n=1 Tax=Mythimna loreyi TaxID=667449 RepID=A0ACC2Q3X6_9NEOP|nr:hypothetical protein PYW08_011432 [Mythimna loreyi]